MSALARITDEDIDRALGSRSLIEYAKMCWAQVEPARPFMDNWHLSFLAEHFEAVTAGQIKRLVINQPPGTMKSLLGSVFWPSWTWTRKPETKWITASYSEVIARRDSLRARRLMESRWWQARWGHLWRKNADEWTGKKYSNNKAGFRLAVTVEGAVTGEHGDYQLVDDPIKPLEAAGAKLDSVKLLECIQWWDETMTGRVVSALESVRVILMQRLHDIDLSGHALKSGDYVHVNLPMRGEHQCVIAVPHACTLKEDAKGNPTQTSPIGLKDPRAPGELLWPSRFPESVQAIRKKELGSRGVAAQDQQRPLPVGGGIFKRERIKFWREWPKRNVQIIQSWDCSFKEINDADHVVGEVWARSEGQYYLLDLVRDRMSFNATCIALLALSRKWPRAVVKLVEDKANGPAVINAMEKKIPGLLAVNPKGGKAARANAVEPLWESGCVFLPHPDIAPWVNDFIEEVVKFSGIEGQPDDQVDSMTQALSYLYEATCAEYTDAMKEDKLRAMGLL